MFLKLPDTYVDPRTQAPLPDAVLVVSDCEFRMRAGDTRIMAAVYANPSVVGVAQPIAEYPVTLGPAEIAVQLPPLLGALYQVLEARPEYSGSTLVP
jgi:hypothetical protein